jgi:hypothetical protein
MNICCMTSISKFKSLACRSALAVACGFLAAGVTPNAEAGCAPPPDGIVSWLPLDGNTQDIVRNTAGIAQGSPAFVVGNVGQALQFDGQNDAVTMAAASQLNVGSKTGMTIELWINPSDLSHLRPLVEWNSGTIGAHFWTGVDVTVPGDGVRNLYVNLVDTSGVSHNVGTPVNLVTVGQWQHVAMTYDKVSGSVAIFHNGALAASRVVGQFTPLTTGDLYLGLRPSGPFAGIWFAGAMDEVSVYERALSQAEIQAIVRAGISGKCKAEPPPINRRPVAIAQFLSTSEDTSFAIALQAQDPDGDPLTFTFGTPANGTLTGVAPNLVYTPNRDFSGTDSFSFRASDGQLESTEELVTISVVGTQDPPVAIAKLHCVTDIDGEGTWIAVSANGSNATVVLDGAMSFDVDDDPLVFLWFADGNPLPLASGPWATNQFALGDHSVTLSVDDGHTVVETSVAFRVLTIPEALDELCAQIEQSSIERNRKRPLLASCRAAQASFQRGNSISGANQLGALREKLEAQMEPEDWDLAGRWDAFLECIIKAVPRKH